MRCSLLLKFLMLACVVVPECAARAQDAASAKSFLQSIYTHYSEFSKADETRYLHPSLIALLREDARAVGPNDVGVLDGDPFCGCQDMDGIFDLEIAVREPNAGKIDALVSFFVFKDAKPTDRRSLVITLAPEKGGWRVWNVVDRSDPKFDFDLRSELQNEIRNSKRATKNPTSQKRDVGHPR